MCVCVCTTVANVIALIKLVLFIYFKCNLNYLFVKFLGLSLLDPSLCFRNAEE